MFDGEVDFLHHFFRSFERTMQKYDKFIAAPAADKIFFADTGVDGSNSIDDKLVAYSMAERIVHMFQPVNVNETQRILLRTDGGKSFFQLVIAPFPVKDGSHGVGRS